MNIKVRNSRGKYLYFRMKKNAQMKKLMDFYCERDGHVKSYVSFIYED